jgi:hypothetical protein
VAKVLIRETTLADVAALVANIREADRREVQAYGYDALYEPIARSVMGSILCWTGEIDGQLAAILGVSPVSVLGGIGSPWMLGTAVLDKHSRVLVRETPRYIARMQRAFPTLENYVHAENASSIRWLRRLGFTLHPAQPYGAHGAMFHRFEKRA